MNRQYMIDYREKNGIDLARMAQVCGCSQKLLELLEADDGVVTHPNIAKRVARAYRLTRKRAEELLPVNYRPSSPLYDPDRHKVDELSGALPEPPEEEDHDKLS